MADILPSIPDASASEDARPRVVGLDEDAADDVFAALSSDTARSLFAALNDDPAHPSALADRVDTSLQNAQYHLGKLEDAGLVEVVDTAYSAKGREMDVYAPADQPLVVFAGDEEDQSLLAKALGRLLGGLGILSAASVVAEGLFGDENSALGDRSVLGTTEDAGAADSGDAGTAATDDADVDSQTADDGGGSDAMESEDAVEATADRDANEAADGAEPAVDAVSTVADDLAWVGDLLAVSELSPGLTVLLLGSAALGAGLAAWYVHERATVE